ncbi:MAG: hypothetical protein OFPI_25700 [Osedax symbiont Rs2]|nr:MAG: hypothetical protein OFPI_25700 [Osedax symbiont Rs2]
MLKKVINNVFTEILWPNWKQNSSHSVSPRVWLKTFKKVAKDTNIIPLQLAQTLASSPSLLRIMLNSFKSKENFPSSRDFAINIAFEISQAGFATDLRSLPELWRLRFFAVTVRAQWLTTIDNSFVLKLRFKTLHGCNPLDLITDGADCLPDLDQLLCNRDKLTKAFFNNYSSADADTEVTVWLPDNSGYVATDTSAKVTIPICVNPSKGVDLGFFRQGFNYSTGRCKNRLWLKDSSIDQRQAQESARFEYASLSRLTRRAFNHSGSTNAA